MFSLTRRKLIVRSNKHHTTTLINGEAKHYIMFCAPFILFLVALVCLCIFVFNTVVLASPLWNAIMANNGQSGSEEVDDKIEYVQPVAMSEGTLKYYSLENFPAINWGKKWATLSIESLGAQNIPVYNGDTDGVLDMGIGRYFNSMFPGCGGNCVMCFHVNRQKELYFLEDIEIGALVELNTCYGKYTYQVEDKQVYESNDASYIKRDDGELLTIYTCYPKEGPYRKYRIAVTCKIVEKLSDPLWR